MRLPYAVGPLVALLAGCDGLTYSYDDPPAQAPPADSRFDTARSGTVTGTVRWAGERPAVPGVPVPTFTLTGVPPGVVPHPNAPVLDPATGGVRSAVVSLRGVDPALARPWDHPAVGVEATDTAIVVRQGADARRVGFVRAGAPVRFEGKATNVVGVRGRGGDFFTYLFPTGPVPVVRTLPREGRVELSSASGQYWAAADLFVRTDPYIAQPDGAGRFQFADVPAGRYELVVWHPNWLAGPSERDPETGAIARQPYRPAAEVARPVEVTAGGKAAAAVTLSVGDFPGTDGRP
jgi:hypothetical protein